MNIKKKVIATEDCTRVGEELFFIAKDINIICKMNIVSGEVLIVDSLPEEDLLGKRLGSKIVFYNDELFFAPMEAKKIWRYNLKNRSWKGYERKVIDNWSPRGEMFQAICYKHKVFFVGAIYPAIIVLDLEKDELDYIETPFAKNKKIAEIKKDGYFRTDYVQIDNTIYLASCLTNEVIKFNLETYETVFIEVGAKDNCYAGIAYDGKEFYLAPRRVSPIVVWDGLKSYRELNLPNELISKDGCIFGGIVCKDGNTYLPACFQATSLIINTIDKEINNIVKKQYHFHKFIGEETYVSLDYEGDMNIYEPSQHYQHVLSIDVEHVNTYMKNRNLLKNSKSGIIREIEFVNLEVFLETVINM
ncbi:MAG TPA: hypothetical protein DHW61_01910 [Lachnoclostridium phytofermentans]|uniref:Uncharacterized protein n=1 Tax=Lachnoclostridium phytofermentans TaxID=66219 RepID=A0A3D2X3F8_9FIRM|nr:hypothetical protein [Lachnoclostridium sp.]HCL01163.1 hypothetical protein [Lachnoclostridium phytofermentans]